MPIIGIVQTLEPGSDFVLNTNGLYMPMPKDIPQYVTPTYLRRSHSSR